MSCVMLESTLDSYERPTVIKMTREECEAKRREWIAESGLDEETFRSRGENFQLYPEHQILFESVKGMDYLLGES